MFCFGAVVQGILEEIFLGRSIDLLILLEGWIVINNVKIHYSLLIRGKGKKYAKEKFLKSIYKNYRFQIWSKLFKDTIWAAEGHKNPCDFDGMDNFHWEAQIPWF